MKQFMEYHPHLEYKRKLEAILEEFNTNEFELPEHDNIPDIPKETKFLERIRTPDYTPSESLIDAVAVTPTDVLIGLQRAKDNVKKIKEKIIDKLRNDATKGLPIEEYIKAREENNMDTVFDFEDMNSQNIEGSTDAEALPILYRFEKDLAILEETILPIIFDDTLPKESSKHNINLANPALLPAITYNPGDTIYEHQLKQKNRIPTLDEVVKSMDNIRSQEEKEINRLIELDKRAELDTDELNESNHIRQFAQNQTNLINNISEGFGNLSEEINHAYPDGMVSIGNKIQASPGGGSGIARVGRVRFDHYSKITNDAKQRIERLIDPLYKRDLLLEFEQRKRHKSEAKQTLEWVASLNPESDDDPLNLFLFDVIKGIEDIKAQHDVLTQDLYKITDLEEMQMLDYISGLEGKEMIRKMYGVIGKEQ